MKGCGKPTHVSGTNGGTMPCGAMLTMLGKTEPYYCAKCQPCYPTVTLAATDDRPSFAGNTHRVVLKEETADSFIGWPDPSDPRNSDQWQVGDTAKMLGYPKFAWKKVPNA